MLSNNLELSGHSELAPTSAPRRMNDKWSGNSFLLTSPGGYLSGFFPYLTSKNPQAGC
jgi:hypothetical protein